MIHRRDLLKFLPLWPLVERLLRFVRREPAPEIADNPIYGITIPGVGLLWHEPYKHDKPYDVIYVETTMLNQFSPVVQVPRDDMHRFVRVVAMCGLGRVLATFPWSDAPGATKERAVAMACNFVRSMCWYVPNTADAMRRYDEMKSRHEA